MSGNQKRRKGEPSGAITPGPTSNYTAAPSPASTFARSPAPSPAPTNLATPPSTSVSNYSATQAVSPARSFAPSPSPAPNFPAEQPTGSGSHLLQPLLSDDQKRALQLKQLGQGPPIDYYELKIESFERLLVDEKGYRVREMAQILDIELKDCTYKDDSTLVQNMFADGVIPIERKKFLASMRGVEKEYMPDFLKQLKPTTAGAKRKKKADEQKKRADEQKKRADEQKKKAGLSAAKGKSRQDDSDLKGDDEEEDEEDEEDEDSDEDEELSRQIDPSFYINKREQQKDEKAGKPEEPSDEVLLSTWFNAMKHNFNLLSLGTELEETTRCFDPDSSIFPMLGATLEKRKPDMILLDAPKITNNTNSRWPFARAAIEVTRLPNFPRSLMEELAQRADLLLYNSPGRRFVTIMAISGAEYMISVYHRSGVNHSKKYNIFKNFYAFHNFIAGLLFCHPKDLGFDPEIELNDAFQPAFITFKGVRYTILSVLDVKEGIQGRGTVCFELMHPVTFKRFTLKVSWIEETSPDMGEHDTEVAFYQSMNKKSIKEVPFMVDYEDAIIDGAIDSTDRWRPLRMKNFRSRKCRKLLLDGVGRPFTEFKSLKEMLSATIDIFKGHGRLFFVADILHMDMSLRNIMLVDRYPKLEPSASKKGKGSISRAKASGSADSDVIASSGSRSSEDAFLFDADAEEDESVVDLFRLARGMIVDFDFSAFVHAYLLLKDLAEKKADIDSDGLPLYFKKQERRLKMRTGTLPYMAIQVLLGAGKKEQPFVHTYQHDAESIIYGLMKMCIYQAGPRSKKRNFDEDPIPSLFSGTSRSPIDYWVMRDSTWADLAFGKTLTWTLLEDFYIPCMHSYFHRLGPMFVELRDVLFPKDMAEQDYRLKINSEAKYGAILRVLRKYRDKMPDEPYPAESESSPGGPSPPPSSLSGPAQNVPSVEGKRRAGDSSDPPSRRSDRIAADLKKPSSYKI